MKNKIEILAEGKWVLPVGTKLKRYMHSELEEDIILKCCTEIDTKAYISDYKVDFSDLPPLYPTKGMEVPEGGIEFVCGKRILLLVGDYGFAGKHKTVDYNPFLTSWDYFGKSSNSYELIRTLPKTLTVCAECFKEVCECKQEEGWYRVLTVADNWYIRYFNGNTFRNSDIHSTEAGFISDYKEIDWANPISAKPITEEG